MTEYPLGQAFEQWAAKNASRFRGHDLILIERKQRYSTYRFNGIVKQLSLHIGEDGQFMVIVTHRGRFWDIIGEWDIHPVKVKGGYRCESCQDGKVYRLKADLLIGHSAQDFAEWVRLNFRSGKRLLLGRDGSSTWAKVVSKVPNGAKSVPLIKRTS